VIFDSVVEFRNISVYYEFDEPFEDYENRNDLGMILFEKMVLFLVINPVVFSIINLLPWNL
jgi:hypothetical protein